MKNGVWKLLALIGGISLGAVIADGRMRKEVKKKEDMSRKHLVLFLMMNQWVKVKQEGKHLASYFVKNGYQNIAIYGMSYAGEALLNELKGTEIQVAYGIDQNAGSVYSDIDIVSNESNLREVDAIVVTAITFFEQIEEMLADKVQCPVISLEDILYEV